MQIYTHFYFYVCSPEDNSVREELKIVGITSLIEAMMGSSGYKDMFGYIEEERLNKGNAVHIEDYKKFKEVYFQRYGATKRIKEYFNIYIDKADCAQVLDSIEKFSKSGTSKGKFTSVDELADFLYQMRSDFVHKAKMVFLCPGYSLMAVEKIGDSYFILDVNLKKIQDIFEKSFVLFWKKKGNLI